MPTRPADDVFRERMTPAEIDRSNQKADALKAGAMIARLREEAGLSQLKLAERLGGHAAGRLEVGMGG